MAYVDRPIINTRNNRMKIVFVLNPIAGGSSARRKRQRLIEALTVSDLEYEIRYTEHRCHASQIARAAAEAGHAVVAVGGDGTAHEVASGIMESGDDVPMGVLPTGTGNDFAKMLDVPDTLETTLQSFQAGHCTRIDAGQIQWDGPTGAGMGNFINIGGTGFDAKVAAAASSFKLLTGTLRYVVSVLGTLRSWEAPEASVKFSVGSDVVYSYTGRLFLVLAGNGVCSGGGFYLTPGASIIDGMLDTCIIRDISIFRVLTLMPAALRGNHGSAGEVTIERVERVHIESKVPLPIQADGEILTQGATEIEIRVMPGALRILLPVRM